MCQALSIGLRIAAVRPLTVSLKSDTKILTSGAGFMRRVIAEKRYDAVISHAPWSTVLAAPAVRRADLPLLAWMHDAPHGDQWLERRLARTPPDRFICNSRYTAALVAQWMPGVARTVIHPPVVTSMPRDDRAGVRRELGEPDETVVVFMAARLEPWKGHRVLLQAARLLRGGGRYPIR